MHSSALALYPLSLSMPMNCRPGIFDAAHVLPLPLKGVDILSSGSVNAPGRQWALSLCRLGNKALEATMADVKWHLKGRNFSHCNCSYGCPCQFNALPTHGNC